MLTYTNSTSLAEYKKASDRENNVKNFRLYYKEKPTNLIWYDGKIIFVSKEYFLLKNLINLDVMQKQKCSLFLSDIKLIDELKKKNIKFVLEGNLKELISRVGILARNFSSDEVSVELINDTDYSKLNEPIYLGDGIWMNI